MAEGKNLVGVDIGASAIKVVQLRESRKKLQVVKWGYAPLAPQTIIDGHIMNASAVTEALAKFSRKPRSSSAKWLSESTARASSFENHGADHDAG